MRQRLIGAAVLVPVVIIVFLAGQPWLNLGIGVLAVLAAWEASALVTRAGLRSFTWLAISAPILTLLAFQVVLRPGGVEQGWTLLAPAFAAWLMVAGLPALREHDPGAGFRAWLGTVFAGMYPSLLTFAAGIALLTTQQLGPFSWQLVESGRAWLIVLVGTVWAFDSFAYVTGRFYGRGRFMYHISPAKTWSGVIGGSVAAVIGCASLGWLLFGLEPWWGATLGLLLGFAAQTGDLAESMLKRAAGVKDSGNLIPGHGGFLDRVDSFLFAAPALYAAIVTAELVHAGAVL